MKLLNDTITKIQPLDQESMGLAQERLDKLTKPLGSLGILEKIACQFAGIKRTGMPRIPKKKTIILMAGDHGVVEEGVSAFPQEVTPQMVYNFINGGAGINVLARHTNTNLLLVDIGVATELPDLPGLIKKKVALGTKNIAKGSAMTREEAILALEVGIEIANEAISQGAEVLGLGEMGIGNTTPSSAIISVFSDKPVEEVIGRGTGISDEGLSRKTAVIKKSIEINNPDKNDPIDVLAKVGGFEIAGLAGVILGAVSNNVPVVIDGFISSAAVVIATAIAPLAKDYLICSHLSVEPGHKTMLDFVGVKPMLLMDMRLGEGTGAALGMTIVDAALKVINEMATFEEAGVSEGLK